MSIKVSSTELKARETLELIACGPVDIDARLGEVRRPVERITHGVMATRRARVAGKLDDRHHGWETPAQAAERFHPAIAERLPGPVVAATHGMVLTAWLAWLGKLNPGERAAQFWDDLALPDVVEVEIN